MKKILIIGMTENIGGIEKFILGIVKNAPNKKYEFDILDTCKKGKNIVLSDELEKYGCKIIKITNRKDNYIKSFLELKSIVRNNKYDLIHYNLMSYKWFEPIIIANKEKVKIIVHCHIDPKIINYGLFGYILNNVGKLITKKSSMIRIACGNLCGKNFFGNKKFDVIYNGVEVQKFVFDLEKRKQIRKIYNIDDSTIVLCNVARFTHQKNISYLIDVFKEYNLLNGNSLLILVGDGEEKEAIINKIDKNKLNSKVILAGVVTNVNDFYSASDIFVMPSLYEGFSISLVEAQANGLKCITSKNVDSECNITGNVDFLSINDPPKNWAIKLIKYKTEDRTKNNFPESFNEKNSYKRLYKLYDE